MSHSSAHVTITTSRAITIARPGRQTGAALALALVLFGRRALAEECQEMDAATRLSSTMNAEFEDAKGRDDIMAEAEFSRLADALARANKCSPALIRHLGERQRKQGKFAAALASFNRIRSLPVDGRWRAWSEDIAAAEATAQQLERDRPPRITVTVDAPSDSRRHVLLDGARLTDEQLRQPLDVPPGERVVEVVADGYEPKAERFQISEWGRHSLHIELQEKSMDDEPKLPPASPLEARGLFMAGIKYCRAKKWDDAVEAFQLTLDKLALAKQKLDPSTLFNLGVCAANGGQNALAWANLKKLVTQQRTPAAEDQGWIFRRAERLVQRLEPMVLKVPITLGLGVTRLRVDGEPLEFAMAVGDQQFFAPVRSMRAGRRPVTSTFILVVDRERGHFISVEQYGMSFTVDLARGWSKPIKLDRESPARDPERPFVLGVGLLGVGGAAAIVGTVAGLMANADLTDAEKDPALCPSKQCSQAGFERVEAAKLKGNVATGGFVIAGVAASAGLVALWAPWLGGAPATRRPPVAQVSPAVGPHRAGIALTGTLW